MLLLCAAICTPAIADPEHDFVFFGSVDTFTNKFSDPPAEAADSFVRPTLDVLYTYSGDRFRILGEYLWSSTEAELERLKVGWQANSDTMIWLGRYHAASNYWTGEYHHGQFLQTSITRPSVEEWEDESGPMPSHFTGFLIEQERDLGGERALNWSIAAGLAPKFVVDELVPFDLLDPEGGHGTGLNARIVYRPEVLRSNQVGLLLGWSDINVESESGPNLVDLDEIKQTTVGVFGDWRWEKWRLIANLTYFGVHLEYVDRDAHDKFAVSYLQLEYEANEDWTVFGRSDNGLDEDTSLYLKLLPAFIAHRNMLGVRWDFTPLQSLTAEIATTSAQGLTRDHNHFKELRLQWSGVLQ